MEINVETEGFEKPNIKGERGISPSMVQVGSIVELEKSPSSFYRVEITEKSGEGEFKGAITGYGGSIGHGEEQCIGENLKFNVEHIGKVYNK